MRSSRSVWRSEKMGVRRKDIKRLSEALFIDEDLLMDVVSVPGELREAALLVLLLRLLNRVEEVAIAVRELKRC